MRRLAVGGLATALLIGAGRHAWAQSAEDLSNLSLEDLMNVRVERVFGASRRDQPTTEAPSSVTIVTAEDISRLGYRTLADILRGVRGLFVTDDRNYSYVGARGFARPGDYNTGFSWSSTDTASTTRYSIRRRSASTSASTWRRSSVSRSFAARPRRSMARARSSPSSASRRDAGKTSTASAVRAGAGNLGRVKANGFAGRRFGNGLDVAFAAGVEDIDGQDELYFPEFDDPSTNDGLAIGIDDESLQTISGRASYHDFTVTGAYGGGRRRCRPRRSVRRSTTTVS